jgi:hypothetical protein
VQKTATDHTSEPRADRAGFDALFDESFERMKRLAFLLGADDPENIAQEAFVRLHSRWRSLNGTDKALPYLRRTVVNLSRSRLRHLKVVRRAPKEPDRDIVSAEATVLAGHANRAVHEALLQLTPRQRQVPRWPSGPQHSTRVETRSVLAEGGLDSGPVPGLMLFLADPVVTDLEVRRGDGSGVSVRELDRIDGLALFLADFAGSTQGFGYTAYDGAGNVVESAIT